MIGRQRLVLGGDLGAFLVGQLLGVQADAEAMGARGGEGALDLGGREGDGLAKGVDAGRQLAARRFGDELVGRFLDESLAVGAGREARAAPAGSGTMRTSSSSPSSLAMPSRRSSLAVSKP